MKKRIFLKSLLAIALLVSLLLSTVLGTSNAQYFKEFFSQPITMEGKPDLTLQYYLYDYHSTGGNASDKVMESEYGVYKNSSNFTQNIVVGRDAQITGSFYDGANWKSTDPSKNKGLSGKDSYTNADLDYTKYIGEKIIYQIKIPVDETGYYTLDFAVDFLKKNTTQEEEFFSLTYDRAIGCEVVTAEDNIPFGETRNSSGVLVPPPKLDLYTRSENNKVYLASINEADGGETRRFDTDATYQWKTLAPSRQEYVSLAFRVDEADVQNGYVIWMWDFSGLYGAKTYNIEFNDVSFEKTMNLDGTTEGRTSSDPYFMFPQAELVNNQLLLSLINVNDKNDRDSITDDKNGARAMDARGKVSYSQGRGTFATTATTNSLQIQAESLGYGWSDKEGIKALLTRTNGDTYANPIAFYVPVINIKPNTTYKVTFDISIARQGDYTLDSSTHNASAINGNYMTNSTLADYASVDNMFKMNEANVFSSYLDGNYSSHETNRSTLDHQRYGMKSVVYANKFYNTDKEKTGASSSKTDYIPLTKYDEFTWLNDLKYTICDSVNDTYSQDPHGDSVSAGIYRSMSRNWFNAVEHTENNGQNKIDWLTFYNTTFSFNIDPNNSANSGLGVDANGYITGLEWAWVIDSVLPMCYYRIRLDNVRIQEVVNYGSNILRNGVKIAGTRVMLENSATSFHEEDNKNLAGIFASFRGINGVGQNWQAKGHNLNDANRSFNDKIFMAEGNIYAPIIDAKLFPALHVTNDTKLSSDDDYKITLNGYATCQGGIDRYVYSVDGGVTWHDMTLTMDGNSNGVNDPSKLAVNERAVDQLTVGQTRYYQYEADATIKENTFEHFGKASSYEKYSEFATFTSNDAANGNFSNWNLVADLKAFKHQGNLDVIIAAVPASNENARCEILRIINYNPVRDYVTHTENIISDIEVGTAGNYLNAYYSLGSSDGNDENTENYSIMRGINLNGVIAWRRTGYASIAQRSNDYDYIRALYSGIPVKTSLRVQGVAMTMGMTISYYNEAGATIKGTYTDPNDGYTVTMDGADTNNVRHADRTPDGNYYWTADGGITWNPCTVRKAGDVISDFRVMSQLWYDGYEREDKYFETYRGDNGYLEANLSAYIGQVVDVLFAAQPQGSDVYVPVARVDSVAVYGQEGTFYTKIDSVTVDGTSVTPTYFDISGAPLNRVTSGSGTPQWNLGYSATNGAEFSYTIFEPYNIDFQNTRLYSSNTYDIGRGDSINITGYAVAGTSGFKASSYKYTLDGGKTWTAIGSTVGNVTDIAYAEKSDVSFVTASGVNGSFASGLQCSISSSAPTGVHTLVVVAEGKTNGKLYPIIALKINITA